MKKMILVIVLMIVGLILIVTSPSKVYTGATVFKMDGAATFVGIILIAAAVFVIIGKKSLEILVNKELKEKSERGEHGQTLKEIEEMHKSFIEKNAGAYKRHLEREGKVPGKIKEHEKTMYAKEKLEKKFEPLVEYNSDNSIEYIEHFGHSPLHNKTPIPYDKSVKELPCKVNWKIIDPVLLRITEDDSKDDQLWNAARRKIYNLTETGELGKKNETYKIVPGSKGKIVYFRDRGSGARIFLEKNSNNEYNLIAIASGQQNKREEQRVFDRLKKLNYQISLKK